MPQEAPEGKKRQPQAIAPHEYRTAYKVIEKEGFTMHYSERKDNGKKSVRNLASFMPGELDQTLQRKLKEMDAEGNPAGHKTQRKCPTICYFYNQFYAGVDIADMANNHTRWDHKTCASKGKSRSYMRVVFALLGFSIANANRLMIVDLDKKLRA